jgi:hypothetical protein
VPQLFLVIMMHYQCSCTTLFAALCWIARCSDHGPHVLTAVDDKAAAK